MAIRLQFTHIRCNSRRINRQRASRTTVRATIITTQVRASPKWLRWWKARRTNSDDTRCSLTNTQFRIHRLDPFFDISHFLFKSDTPTTFGAAAARQHRRTTLHEISQQSTLHSTSAYFLLVRSHAYHCKKTRSVAASSGHSTSSYETRSGCDR